VVIYIITAHLLDVLSYSRKMSIATDFVISDGCWDTNTTILLYNNVFAWTLGVLITIQSIQLFCYTHNMTTVCSCEESQRAVMHMHYTLYFINKPFYIYHTRNALVHIWATICSQYNIIFIYKYRTYMYAA